MTDAIWPCGREAPRGVAGPECQRRSGSARASGAPLLAQHEQVKALDLFTRPGRLAQHLETGDYAGLAAEAMQRDLLGQAGPAEVGHQVDEHALQRQAMQGIAWLSRRGGGGAGFVHSTDAASVWPTAVPALLSKQWRLRAADAVVSSPARAAPAGSELRPGARAGTTRQVCEGLRFSQAHHQRDQRRVEVVVHGDDGSADHRAHRGLEHRARITGPVWPRTRTRSSISSISSEPITSLKPRPSSSSSAATRARKGVKPAILRVTLSRAGRSLAGPPRQRPATKIPGVDCIVDAAPALQCGCAGATGLAAMRGQGKRARLARP